MQCKCGTNFDVTTRDDGRMVHVTTGTYVVGGKCILCTSSYNREAYIKRRGKKKTNENKAEPMLAMSHRKCRGCGAQLKVDRYFNCVTCLPRNQVVDEYTIYYGESSDDLGEELK